VTIVLPAKRDVSERPWQRDAACRGPAHSGAFYPPVHHETRDQRAQRELLAKALCQTCPVRRACLEHALCTREPFGIWGGLTEHERRAMLEPGS
jgi:WhiB family transcriptional regulator, redox-sensing transcriptional regulator